MVGTMKLIEKTQKMMVRRANRQVDQFFVKVGENSFLKLVDALLSERASASESKSISLPMHRVWQDQQEQVLLDANKSCPLFEKNSNRSSFGYRQYN